MKKFSLLLILIMVFSLAGCRRGIKTKAGGALEDDEKVPFTLDFVKVKTSYDYDKEKNYRGDEYYKDFYFSIKITGDKRLTYFNSKITVTVSIDCLADNGEYKQETVSQDFYLDNYGNGRTEVKLTCECRYFKDIRYSYDCEGHVRKLPKGSSCSHC